MASDRSLDCFDRAEAEYRVMAQYRSKLPFPEYHSGGNCVSFSKDASFNETLTYEELMDCYGGDCDGCGEILQQCGLLLMAETDQLVRELSGMSPERRKLFCEAMEDTLRTFGSMARIRDNYLHGTEPPEP